MKPASCMAAAITVLASTAAQAQVHASTTLQNFGWTLTDLQPDDGIAPALYLNSLESQLEIRDSFENPRRRYRETFTSSALPPPPSTISYTLGTREVSASLTGSLLGMQLQASGPRGADIRNGDWQRAESYALMTYYLAPRTEVTFHAQFMAEAGSADPITGQYAASGVLQASAHIFAVPGFDYDVYSMKLGLGETDTSRVHDLFLTIANDSDSMRLAAFSVRQAAHIGNAFPVPEPSAWAMLAAGLALLGLRRRY